MWTISADDLQQFLAGVGLFWVLFLLAIVVAVVRRTIQRDNDE